MPHFRSLALAVLLLTAGCSDSNVQPTEDNNATAGSGGATGGSSGSGGVSGASGGSGGAGSGGSGGSGGSSDDGGVDAAIDAAIDDAGDLPDGELADAELADADLPDGSDAPDSGDVADAAPDAAPDAEEPFCTPFDEEPCPGGTDVGACQSGTRTCNEDGSAFGACTGQIAPVAPGCGSQDLDCNGQMDGTQDVDQDGDGYSRCASDCCDSEDDCADPAAVNPGAYDFPGDGIDNDCTDTADDEVASCDASLASNSGDATDYARALDLCKLTIDSAPPSQRTWGLLSVAFSRANGAGAPAEPQKAIRSSFGAITSQRGAGMIVLSTGVAAVPGQIDPAYVAPAANDHAITSAPPADWLAAHAGTMPPVAPSCPTTLMSVVHDPVMLTIAMRVPTNARAFTLDGYFLSGDYPEWVCSRFNDYFLALLSSSFGGTPANPSDRNIAAVGSTLLGVGLVRSTSLFRTCLNGSTGCQMGATAGTTNACTSTTDLTGTGYEVANPSQCDAGAQLGGGTGWLRFGGNVVPGEIAYLRLVLWDSEDGFEDSKILLDNFRWLEDEITPGLGLIE